ncbi:MAG: hypothetical protein H6Q70_1135 [Firmicutes bacterium]|nr:hypothetical protein [Bacillota bacterium]
MIKCRLILQTDRYYSITKFLLETSILIYPYDQEASTLTSPNITTCTPVKLLVIDADIIKALLIDTILTSHKKISANQNAYAYPVGTSLYSTLKLTNKLIT